MDFLYICNMEKNNKITFAEYVSPGHPDKVADIISQYILDRYIEKDPNVRYAVEVMVKGNHVLLTGEVSSSCHFDDNEYRNFVRQAYEEIGYTHEYFLKWGKKNIIDPWDLNVEIYITTQSPEISQGVNAGGWGDQGVFYGYADYKGDVYRMPKTHSYAKSLCRLLYSEAKNNGIGGLDIKTEIVIEGGEVTKVIAAVPCRNDIEKMSVYKNISAWCTLHEITGSKIILNGTGNYTSHGPVADSGVTGRKLAVDFYGGGYAIGGGAVIKDSTKADVSLNLYARKMALEYAAKYNATSVIVSLACCIGSPVVDYCVEEVCGGVLESGKKSITPAELKSLLGLDKPIYTSMHMFGLFGEFQQDKAWEEIYL